MRRTLSTIAVLLGLVFAALAVPQVASATTGSTQYLSDLKTYAVGTTGNDYHWLSVGYQICDRYSQGDTRQAAWESTGIYSITAERIGQVTAKDLCPEVAPPNTIRAYLDASGFDHYAKVSGPTRNYLDYNGTESQDITFEGPDTGSYGADVGNNYGFDGKLVSLTCQLWRNGVSMDRESTYQASTLSCYFYPLL